jgi:predicted N-acetyltransferase YhbS
MVYTETYSGPIARPNSVNGINQTYVFTDDSNEIFGYYCISSGSITADKLPKGFPYAQVPTIKLGRLAVSIDHSGKGIGPFLLTDAIDRIIDLADQVGIYCITVDAIDEEKVSFYLHHNFTRLEEDGFELFMSIEKARSSKIRSI